MDFPEEAAAIAALKFITGGNENICRLCFSSTQEDKYYLHDRIMLDNEKEEDCILFNDMIMELGIIVEPLLPKSICSNCANAVIQSYTFKRHCQESTNIWNQVFNSINKIIVACEPASSNVKSSCILLKESNIYAIKKPVPDKKQALNKLKQIIRTKTSPKKEVICEKCGMKFKSKHTLKKHAKLHSNENHSCNSCPKVFPTLNHLQMHTERIHLPKRIKCSQCTKQFSTMRQLSNHENNYHIPACCNICHLKLSSKHLLRSHMDQHNGQKCPLCNKTFLSKTTYKMHSKICNKDRKLCFFCDICQKGYVRKNSLRTHIKVDHGFGNLFACKWCDKKFDAKSSLNNHIVKHTRMRNFHCDRCGGKFVTHAALIYHVRLHTGEKPYQCDYCDASFLSASRKMEHKRRAHIGPTRECYVCTSKFVTKSELEKHIKKHFNQQSRLFVPNLT